MILHFINRFRIRFISLLIFSLGLAACTTSQKVQKPDENRPTWVKQRPIDSYYYLGIASAPKSGNSSNYFRQKAKESALADIASEISVKVSSTSVLSQMENELGIQSDFRTVTKTKADEFLEGYELVDAWENDYVYWVYYRLSKSAYATLQQERKEEAIRNGVTQYKQAQYFQEQNNIQEAIRFHTQTLAALLPYMGEDLTTTVDGEQMDPAATSYQSLVALASSIKISGTPTIRIKRGEQFSTSQLSYTIQDKSGHLLSGIPCKITYSGKGLTNELTQSNQDGKVRANIEKAIGTKSEEKLNVHIDIVRLFRSATEDLFLRNMAKKLPSDVFETKISIRNPTIWISSSEKNLGRARTPFLVNSIKKEATGSGFSLTTKSKADYQIFILSDTKRGSTSNGMSQVFLNGSFQVRKKNGTIVYEDYLQSIKGVDLNISKATEEAYRKAESTIRIKFFREWQRSFFQ